MLRRDLLTKSVLALMGAPMIQRGSYRLFAASRERYSARAIDLVGRSNVIDMLGLPTMDWPQLYAWFRRPATFGSSDLGELRGSGISVFHPAVDLPGADPHASALNWLASWNTFLAQQDHAFARIDRARDLDRVKHESKIGILLGLQNSRHFRTIQDVAIFHALGQRLSQLTYNSHNRLGSGCTEHVDRGLTAFGAEIVGEMNRLGMAVDVSHAGDRTTLDAFAVSTKPVLITHSNCRAISRHPRCKPDSIIRRMARTGSVMGITGVRAFVRSSGPATIEHVLDHFDHVARVAGVEHIGIGSDSAVAGAPPRRSDMDTAGLNHPRRVFDLTEGLVRRGYSDVSIQLILGGNFRRVLGETLGD